MVGILFRSIEWHYTSSLNAMENANILRVLKKYPEMKSGKK